MSTMVANGGKVSDTLQSAEAAMENTAATLEALNEEQQEDAALLLEVQARMDSRQADLLEAEQAHEAARVRVDEKRRAVGTMAPGVLLPDACHEMATKMQSIHTVVSSIQDAAASAAAAGTRMEAVPMDRVEALLACIQELFRAAPGDVFKQTVTTEAAAAAPAALPAAPTGAAPLPQQHPCETAGLAEDDFAGMSVDAIMASTSGA